MKPHLELIRLDAPYRLVLRRVKRPWHVTLTYTLVAGATLGALGALVWGLL